MEIITIECPKCKGEFLVKEGTKQIFCMYYRAKVQVKLSNSDVIGDNHEFKARLAIAKHNETLYMRNQKTFDEVMNSYDDVRLVGAHYADYWLFRARFFTTGKLREFEKGDVELSEQEKGSG